MAPDLATLMPKILGYFQFTNLGGSVGTRQAGWHVRGMLNPFLP
jgi:hypothetical protein